MEKSEIEKIDDWAIKNIGKLYIDALKKHQRTGIKISPEKLEQKTVSLISYKLKIKPKKVYAIMGKVQEDAGEYKDAVRLYRKAGMNENANDALKKMKST